MTTNITVAIVTNVVTTVSQHQVYPQGGSWNGFFPTAQLVDDNPPRWRKEETTIIEIKSISFEWEGQQMFGLKTNVLSTTEKMFVPSNAPTLWFQTTNKVDESPAPAPNPYEHLFDVHGGVFNGIVVTNRGL